MKTAFAMIVLVLALSGCTSVPTVPHCPPPLPMPSDLQQLPPSLTHDIDMLFPVYESAP